MRLPLLAAALGLASLPLHADPLPQGEFMLGSRVWSDEMLPRFATVFIEGTAITLELSSPIPMNIRGCDTSGDCVYSLTAATARAEGDGLNLTISGVDILPAPPESVWDDIVPPSSYAEHLLGMMDTSTVLETEGGFALTTASGPIEFLRTDADARDAIRAYAIMLDLSINQLGGCEVRGLASLFARDDLSDAETAFIRALSGAVRVDGLSRQIRAIDPFEGTLDQTDEEAEAAVAQARALRVRSMLPVLLGSMQQGPVAPSSLDPVWNDIAVGLWDGDRERYDADIASYGDTLFPLARFLRHMRTIEGPIRAQTACQDLSFGFIAAQDGG